MQITPSSEIAFSPGIQCLIPLFYAAWADRVLTPTEVSTLRAKADDLFFLTDDDKQLALEWSSPSRPPDAFLFRHWEQTLRKGMDAWNGSRRPTLTDLGLLMAEQAADQWDGDYPVDNWQDPKIVQKLQGLEIQLKSLNLDTYRSLFDAPSTEITGIAPESKVLQKFLDGPYGGIRQTVQTLLSDPVFHRRHYDTKEAYRGQVLDWIKALARQKMGALAYPHECGGKNDMGQYAAVFETLGYFDLSLAVKFGVQFGLFGGAIHALGTERHHKAFLGKAGSLELPGCFAMTETDHGSNVRGLETTASYDAEAGEFIIHTPTEEAGKEYIGNALHGRMAVVFAQLTAAGTNHGVHAFLVPMRDENHDLLPGVRVEDCGYKLGLNGVDNGRIWFDHVRVPRFNLLNRFGDVGESGDYSSPIQHPDKRFFTMLGTLVGGRVCVPRAGLSAAKTAVTIAVRYGLRRRQFSPGPTTPETLLLDYPSHQRRLMPLLAKAFALDIGLKKLTDRYLHRSEADMREIETLAAGLKSCATWFATRAIQECREACGGKGYLWENRFADLKADTEIFTTFEGDNTVLMQLVAKGVLSAFQKEFMEEGARAILRYVGQRINTSFTEQNPFVTRQTDKEHLLSSEFQLNAFRFRERRLLYSLSQRLRNLVKSGFSAYAAGLECQNHMLALAEAFVERWVLEALDEKISSAQDAALTDLLDPVRSLYALQTIEGHKGWYLEQEYIQPVKSKAIRKTVDELCLELRQKAVVLTDAFGIPDHLIAAPIAV